MDREECEEGKSHVMFVESGERSKREQFYGHT